MKTPAIQEVLKPLRRLEIEAADRFKEEIQGYEANEVVAAQIKKEAEKRIRKAISENRDPLPTLWERRSVLQADSQDSMVLPGWEYARRADYRANSYPKPTIFLYTLRGLMGEAAFDDALYTYSERYRFRHPTTEDFVAVIREKTPQEQSAMVDDFMQAMIETAAPLDVAILEASQTELDGKWAVRVKVQRRGQIPFPVQILGEDADGTVTPLAEWSHTARTTTKTFRFERPNPLRSVRVGPSWLRNIDGDVTNNARFVDKETDTRPSAVLATRWTLYVEEVLRTYVGMGR